MKNGVDRTGDETSNVVSFAGVRKRTGKRTETQAPHRETRHLTAGQWLVSALMVLLAAGGIFALAAPLLRATGIVGG